MGTVKYALSDGCGEYYVRTDEDYDDIILFDVVGNLDEAAKYDTFDEAHIARNRAEHWDWYEIVEVPGE